MIYVNINHDKKNHPKIPSTTLVLKYICNFFKVYDKYYFGTNITICLKSSMLVGFFYNID